jgi:hypothetical protein
VRKTGGADRPGDIKTAFIIPRSAFFSTPKTRFAAFSASFLERKVAFSRLESILLVTTYTI